MKLRYLLMVAVIVGAWHLAGSSDDAQQAYREYHHAIIDADLESFKQYIPDAQLKDWSGDDAGQKLAALRGSVPADVEI
ncbi:MAG: hypothetical protein HY762_01765, partial [Planctomycetes bacterium]|nr:hypothetical protein [Planctomycetota bacterium]